MVRLLAPGLANGRLLLATGSDLCRVVDMNFACSAFHEDRSESSYGVPLFSRTLYFCPLGTVVPSRDLA